MYQTVKSVLHGAHITLKPVIDLFQKIAIDEILMSLGWMMTVDAGDFVAQEIRCIGFVKKPDSLAMTHDDLIHCMLFIFS